MVKKYKLVLQTWYKQINGTDVILVKEYPWYHIFRLLGYRFRDMNGWYRDSKGKVVRSTTRLLDIQIPSS